MVELKDRVHCSEDAEEETVGVSAEDSLSLVSNGLVDIEQNF
jgi:hypothetical protein